MNAVNPGERIRAGEMIQRWLAIPAPCGMPHEDPYNPCLPESDDGWLFCCTCGLRQRPAIPARTGDRT